MAQHVDLLVDRRGFSYVSIRDRHIGFGLVVIVVGDKIFNRIIWEKLPQFIAQLRRQGLVVGQHQGGPSRASNHIGDRKSLARARGTKQSLVTLSRIKAVDHGLDGGGLVPLGLIRGMEVEGIHGSILATRSRQRRGRSSVHYPPISPLPTKTKLEAPW